MVIGSRVSKRSERSYSSAGPFGQLAGEPFDPLLYGVRLSDIGSFRVLRCSALEALQMREMTFGWPVEMLVKAAKAIIVSSNCPFIIVVAATVARKSPEPFGSVKAAYYMLRTTLRYRVQGEIHEKLA